MASYPTARPRPQAHAPVSDELRASVFEAAVDLGFQNQTVAKWMFDAIEEGEEPEPDEPGFSPGLVSPATEASEESLASPSTSFQSPHTHTLISATVDRSPLLSSDPFRLGPVSQGFLYSPDRVLNFSSPTGPSRNTSPMLSSNSTASSMSAVLAAEPKKAEGSRRLLLFSPLAKRNKAGAGIDGEDPRKPSSESRTTTSTTAATDDSHFPGAPKSRISAAGRTNTESSNVSLASGRTSTASRGYDSDGGYLSKKKAKKQKLQRPLKFTKQPTSDAQSTTSATVSTRSRSPEDREVDDSGYLTDVRSRSLFSSRKSKKEKKEKRSPSATPSAGEASDGPSTPVKKKKSFFRRGKSSTSDEEIPPMPALPPQLQLPTIIAPTPTTPTRAPSIISSNPGTPQRTPIAERFMRSPAPARTVASPSISRSVTPVPSSAASSLIGSTISSSGYSVDSAVTLSPELWNDDVLLAHGSKSPSLKEKKFDDEPLGPNDVFTERAKSPVPPKSKSSSPVRSTASDDSKDAGLPAMDFGIGLGTLLRRTSLSTSPGPHNKRASRNSLARRINPGDISLPITTMQPRSAPSSPPPSSDDTPSSQPSSAPAATETAFLAPPSTPFANGQSVSAPSSPQGRQLRQTGTGPRRPAALEAPAAPSRLLIPPASTDGTRASSVSVNIRATEYFEFEAPRKSVLDYYNIPPPSPPPNMPLPSLPDVPPLNLGPGLSSAPRSFSRLRQQVDEPQSRETSSSWSMTSVSSSSGSASGSSVSTGLFTPPPQGLFAQPIPRIQRGKESPFPTRPILREDEKSPMFGPANPPVSIAEVPEPSFGLFNKAFVNRVSVYEDDDDKSFYPDEDKTAGRSTMEILERDPDQPMGPVGLAQEYERESFYSVMTRPLSAYSIMDADRSAEVRRNLVRKVGAILDSGDIPSVPPLPTKEALAEMYAMRRRWDA